MNRDALTELAPLLRRAVSLDPAALTRIRADAGRISAMVRLPFGVLAARTIEAGQPADPFDTTVGAAELLAWLDGERSDRPQSRDAQWRSTLPPTGGWRRIDTVPDTEVRPLVRSGALTLKEVAEREGVLGTHGAQPRSEVADALLDSVVLTVTDGEQTAQVNLRTLSAVTRLGFLPRGSHIAVDVAGRWVRVAAAYGSVYAERPGLGLTLR